MNKMFNRSILCIFLVLLFLLTSCQPIQKLPEETPNNNNNNNGDEQMAPEEELDMNVYHPIPDILHESIDGFITLSKNLSEAVIDVSVVPSYDEIIANIKSSIANGTISISSLELITDRETALNDILSINFVGKIDGVAFNGGTADNQVIQLAESTGYIPGFDADLYGIMPGTTVTTEVTFPENYGNDLAGKAASFDITVNGILNVEEYTDSMRETIIIKNLNNYQNTISNKIFYMIEDSSTVTSLPSELVDYYYEDIILSIKQAFVNYNYNSHFTFNEFFAQYYSEADILDEAKYRALEDLLFIAAANQIGSVPTDEEYADELNNIFKGSGFNSMNEMFEKYPETYLKLYILKSKTMKNLIETVTVNSDYDDYKHLIEEPTAEPQEQQS